MAETPQIRWHRGEPSGPCPIRMMMTLCPAGHVHSSLLTDERIPADLRAFVLPALNRGVSPEEVIAEITRVLVELRSRRRHPTRHHLNRWIRGKDDGS